MNLGELKGGESRVGLELKAEVGGQISGAVFWPNGSPARDAQIQINTPGRPHPTFSVSGSEPNDIGIVMTDYTGGFSLGGLVGGPFILNASCTPSVGKGQKVQKAWAAQVEGIELGTQNVQLVLVEK